MRLTLALFFALSLAACEADAPSADTPDSEADRLLARVAPDAFAPAFDALDTRDVVADLTVTEDSAGVEIGATTLRLQLTPEEARLLRQTRTGTLAEPSDDAAPRLRNPIQTALPDDPPYIAPASRDQYRRSVVGDTVVAGRRLRVVEAVLAEAGAEQGVRRVRAAVEPSSGQPVVVEVERTASSAVYDEQSRVRVELAPADGAWLPRHVETDTRTDVPLSPARRVRTAWTVMSVDGRPIGERRAANGER